MKIPRPRRFPALVRALCAAACLVPALPVARVAAVGAFYEYWDPGLTKSTAGGGSGTWDAATADWYSSSSGNDVAYSSSVEAFFQGTAGTVTLNASLNCAMAVDFATSGYTVQDAGGTSYALTISNGLIFSPTSGIATVNVPLVLASGAFLEASITGGTMAVGGAISGSALLGINNGLGSGTVSLSGNNSFNGGLNVAYGTLAAASSTALGTGNVSLAANTQLTLNAGVVLTNQTAATLTLTSATSSIVSLQGTGVRDTVAALVINGVAQPTGLYGAPGTVGATYTPADFVGTGLLAVGVSVVPEPSTWALLGLGVAAMFLGLSRPRRPAA